MKTNAHSFLRRWSLISGAWTACALGLLPLDHAAAANFDWDPAVTGGTVLGGGGVWDAVSNSWWNGTTNAPWANGATDVGVFGGLTSGTVAITTGSGVSANGLTFNTDGYIISGATPGDTLTLIGTTPTITVGNVANTATISAKLIGTNGFTKAGAGKLVLTAPNIIAGGINLTGGTLAGTVRTGAGTINTFANNALNISAGATLDITPTANTLLSGLSRRVFTNSVGVTATSRVDFTQTATGYGAQPATGVDVTINSGTTVLGLGSNAGNNLAVQWTGKIKITNAGSYDFGTSSDDGSRIFIDGVLINNNDGSKGPFDSKGTVTLAAGLHDIRLDYVNGGGGLGETLSYSGADQLTYGVIPSGVLFQAETNTAGGSSNAIVIGSGIGNSVAATGAGTSTINLNGGDFTQVQFGNLNVDTGNTLALTSQVGKTVRFAGPAALGSAVGSATLDTGLGNIALDGAVSDGGNAMTITKLGTGRLVLDQTSVANTLGASTTLDIQAGSVSVVNSPAAGAFSPLGSAGVSLNGVGATLVLDTKGTGMNILPYTGVNAVLGSTTTYNNTITANAAGGVIQNVTNEAVTALTGPLNLGANGITIDSIFGGQSSTVAWGAFTNVSGAITGSGPLNITSTRYGTTTSTIGGMTIVSGNTAGFSGPINVTGNGMLGITSNTQLAGRTINLNAGGISYLFDGNGLGTPGSVSVSSQNLASQNVAFTNDIAITGSGTNIVAVGRIGNLFAPASNLYLNAQNKTAQVGNLSMGTQTLQVNNSNGYGLDVTGNTTLSGAPTFGVQAITLSNSVPGLTLSGVVSGTTSGITKTGSGTLLLTNAGNNFTGNITIANGSVMAVANDGALGDPANQIIINTGAGTVNVGLRVMGTFSTNRTINFASAVHPIEVTAGNTLTLNSPFAGLSATTQLAKGDNGTLVMNSPTNAGWGSSITAAGASAQVLTGGVLVSSGVLRITNAGALGPATNMLAVGNTSGAAVEIAGGITVANPLDLNIQAANSYAGGINWGGQLHSIGNGVTNTWSGALSMNQDAGITADAGNILNITGGLTQNVHLSVFGGAGTINVTTNPILTVHTLDKIGSGTTNLQVNVASPSSGGVRVFAGTLTFSGAAGALATGTVATSVLPGGTLNLDSSTAGGSTVLVNRMGGNTRPLTLTGGNLNLIGNETSGTATNEALGAPLFARGQSTITVKAGTAGANLTFGAVSNNVAPIQSTTASASVLTGATVLFRGTNLGSAVGANNASVQWTAGGLLFSGNLSGGTGAQSKAIVPWAIIDTTANGLGTSFVTGDALSAATNTVAILRPLAAGEYATSGSSLNSNLNMLVTTALTAQPTVSINSLTIDTGGSIALGSAASGTAPVVGNSLTNQSGGVLVRNGVTSTISGGILTAPATVSPLTFHTIGTAALTISSQLNGGQSTSNIGFVKAGDGTLTLSTPKSTIPGLTGYSSNTLLMQSVVNQGKVVLDGGTNTLGTNNYLEVGTGGILDLNGNSQYVLGLFTDGTINGIDNTVTAGGKIIGGVGSTLITNSDARNWAGEISGNVFFNRTGTASVTTIYTPQTSTAGTLINGGSITLRDSGSLASTDIKVQNALLTIDNNQARFLANRISAASTLTLNGGAIAYTGRVQTATTDTMGALVLARANNNIVVTAGGTGVNSTDVTFASLTQQNNAVLNIQTANGQVGSSSRLLFTAVPALTNGILPYAIFGGQDLVTYIPNLGIASLSAIGAQGYDGFQFPATASNPTQNLKLSNASFTIPDAPGAAGTYALNAISYAVNTAAQSINFTDGTDILNLTSGVLNRTGNIVGNIGATVDSGRITAGGSTATGQTQNLYLTVNGGTNALTVNSRIIDNPNGDAVRLVYSPYNSQNVVLTNPNNSYTGGTVVNGGNAFTGTLTVAATGKIPAGGVTINQATLNTEGSGVIDATNVVNINGPGVLSLTDNNTLAGLVINNTGGTTAPIVNSFRAGWGTAGQGTLTIGASGIVLNSENVAQTAIINGRVDMGAAPNTITVNPIMVNGQDVAPLQAGLVIQGLVGSSGGITKNGLGTLQINGQSTHTGTLSVTQGGISFGTLSNTGLAGGSVAGSRYARIDLAAGTRINLNNTDATIGSLSGSGTVTNVAGQGFAGARTFNVGFDGTNSTFSGSFARWSDVLLNPFQVNKIGAGTMTLTGASTTTNNLQVSQGGVTFSGPNGSGIFGTNLVAPTGTLTLDNAGTGLATDNKDNRLGGSTTTGTLNIAGGTFRMVGNAAVATNETLGTVNVGNGTGNTFGSAIVTLEANAAQSLTFTVGTTFGGVPVGASSLIRGISATAGAGKANFALGAIALGTQTGAGTGANGTTTMGIRPDILGDASPTGLGTGFIVKDSVTNFLRPITAAELAPTLFNGQTLTSTNFGLSAVNNLYSKTSIGSLTLNSGGGTLYEPALKPGATALDGLPVSLIVNTGGILALAGNSNLSAGRVETANNAGFYFRTQGNLNVGGTLVNTTAGINKGDAGTLTLNAKNLYGGPTEINEGKIILNGGDNTLPFFATGSTVSLGINHPSAILDLNGTNQTTGTLHANVSSRYAGTGGTLTNSSLTPSLFTTNSAASAQVFGGNITGNLALNKVGNNLLTLTGPNSYTGATTVRANTLVLLDAGTLFVGTNGTSAINLNYAGLNIDQSGLNPIGDLNPTRVKASTPVNLAGGTLTFTPGGGADYSQTIDVVNANAAHNTLSVPQAPIGGSGVLTIGNLVRANADVTVNMVGGNSNFFNAPPGINNSNLILNAINGVPIPATIPNKILGGWALVNNGEFATYVSAGTTGSNGLNFGVATMNGTTGVFTTITQTQYDSNAATLPASNANSNVRLSGTGSIALPAGNVAYNVLAVRTAATAITFTNAADTLNLTAGGLALTNGGTAVGTLTNGRITSGGTQSSGNAPLYVYSAGTSNTIAASIVDNGAGAKTRAVFVPIANSLILTNANTYTGGTVVNGAGGTLNLNAATALTVIPAGGLTLNNALMTMTTTAGQIAAANDVTLNGGSSLTLLGANTLNSISFNNNGGTAAPTVAVGTTGLTLTATNAITSVNDNLTTTPIISGTLLTLPNGANINTSSNVNVPVNLNISAPIATAGVLNKSGTGSLQLSGASTFTGGVNLNAGTLILGISSTGAVTNGPLGTGTLTMANGTALISDGTLRTVANAVTINGNITFGSLTGATGSAVAGHSVALGGAVSLGVLANRIINVNSLLNNSSLTGIVSGTNSGITKTGPGTLTLTGANTYSRGTNINGGTLSSGATGLPAAGLVTFGGGVLQHNGTTTTDFSSKFSPADNQPIYIDTNGNTVTYATPLVSATGGSIGKFGGGTLILTGAANYDGPTIISQGTLQVGAGGTIGDIPTATPILNSGVLLWNRSDADSLTGVISGSGTLTKFGDGTLTVSGTNTFTGNVNIGQTAVNQGGTLQITNSSALGVGPKTVTIISNGTPAGTQAELALDGSGGAINLASNISFTTSQGSLTQPAVVNVAGNNTINGNFTLTSGGGSTSIYSNAGSLNLAGNFTTNTTARFLILGGTTPGTGTVSGQISEGSTTNFLTLQKEGANTWTISNNTNNYTGPTNINAGTLMLGSNNVIPDVSALNLSTGATLNTGGFSDTVGALSVAGTAPTSGAVIDMGAGSSSQLTFANVGTWTGLLSVWNYDGAPWVLGSDKLTFTLGSAGINLANVQFYSDSGLTQIGSGGGLIGNELVPVPEPSAIMSLLALFGLAGYKERRRFFHFRK